MDRAPDHSWAAFLRAIFWTFLTTAAFVVGARIIIGGIPESIVALVAPPSQTGTAAAAVPSPFEYSFQTRGILEEAGSPEGSSSPYWWLDSGARLILEDGVGKTVQGPLRALDRWRIRYAASSAEDTGNGRYPQNLFRLLTRSVWDNVRTDISFRIVNDNPTNTPNRNESNGLLLMSRYHDGDNLYYAGVRVDGHAVIKKKSNGTYTTLAERKIFPGEYHPGANLLPHDEWISLRSETRTVRDAVTIRLFMKREDETSWKLLLATADNGTKDAPLTGTSAVGIRTDFMDVEFDDFRVEKI